MEKVYLITGSTGEYTDRCLWHVGTVSNEDWAKNFVDFMNEKLKGSEELSWKERGKLSDTLREYDPEIWIDYTGTYYSYEEFEVDNIPKIFLKD